MLRILVIRGNLPFFYSPMLQLSRTIIVYFAYCNLRPTRLVICYFRTGSRGPCAMHARHTRDTRAVRVRLSYAQDIVSTTCDSRAVVVRGMHDNYARCCYDFLFVLFPPSEAQVLLRVRQTPAPVRFSYAFRTIIVLLRHTPLVRYSCRSRSVLVRLSYANCTIIVRLSC